MISANQKILGLPLNSTAQLRSMKDLAPEKFETTMEEIRVSNSRS
jgi:hypothetical protein